RKVPADIETLRLQNRASSLLSNRFRLHNWASGRVCFPSVPAMKKKVEFCSHTGNLALMRKFVRGFLDAFPFSEKERTLMVLGVDEACTNIIRHAYHLQDDQPIALSLEAKPDCVCMRLRDYGHQCSPDRMKGRAHDLIKPGGLGLHLIRTAF